MTRAQSFASVRDETLEQGAQLKHRAARSIRHDRRCRVALAVKAPIANARCITAARSLQPALAGLAPRATLALACDDLPTIARTWARAVATLSRAAARSSLSASCSKCSFKHHHGRLGCDGFG
jgi:hypothetical protein